MQENKLLKIINYYGIKNQLKKLSEEIYELQESILCDDNVDHIVEEYTDCLVLLGQICVYYNIGEKEVTEIGKHKVERQLKRIENEKYNNK